MQVKDTWFASKGYFHSFLTFLTIVPPSSTGHSAVTLPPISDGGTCDRCRRNRCKRRSEQLIDDVPSKMYGFYFGRWF